MFSWLSGNKNELPVQSQESNTQSKAAQDNTSLNALSNAFNSKMSANVLNSEPISMCKRAMNDAKTQYETAKENGTITEESVKSCWDNYKISILVGATIGKNHSAVKDLIFKLNADPNIKDTKTGMTPLLFELNTLLNLLSQCETYDKAKNYIKIYLPMIKTLLDAGADPHISNRDGINAFEYSEISGILELDRLMSKYKNNINEEFVVKSEYKNYINSLAPLDKNNIVNKNSQYGKNVELMTNIEAELGLDLYKSLPKTYKQRVDEKRYFKHMDNISKLKEKDAQRVGAWLNEFKKKADTHGNNLGGGTRRKHRGRKAKKSRRHRHR